MGVVSTKRYLQISTNGAGAPDAPQEIGTVEFGRLAGIACAAGATAEALGTPRWRLARKGDASANCWRGLPRKVKPGHGQIPSAFRKENRC